MTSNDVETLYLLSSSSLTTSTPDILFHLNTHFSPSIQQRVQHPLQHPPSTYSFDINGEQHSFNTPYLYTLEYQSSTRKMLSDGVIEEGGIGVAIPLGSADSIFGDDDIPTGSDLDFHDPTLKERADVKRDILQVIAPHRDCNEIPPFTVNELAVMAVLCSMKPSIDEADILYWITSTFRYYGKQALRVYSDSQITDKPHIGRKRPTLVVPKFNDFLMNYDIPLQNAESKAPVNDVNYWDITVPVGRGRLFLSRILEPARKGTFPFLRLPPELRNTIYEMVLSYPKTGLHVCFDEKEHKLVLEAVEREEGDNDEGFAPIISWYYSDRYQPISIGKMGDVLALLHVNKQIHREALPCFYRDNLFYIPNTTQAVHFLCQAPAGRLHLLTKLHIDLDPDYFPSEFTELGSFPAAIEGLLTLEKLKSLKLRADEHLWFDMDAKARKLLGRKSKFTKVAQIPGFELLAVAASRAERLTICGDCPRIEAYLREQIRKIKAEDVPNRTKKRRATRAATKAAAQAYSEDEAGQGGAKKRQKTVTAA